MSGRAAGRRRRDARAHRRALPDLPQHHRRWVPSDARRLAEIVPLALTEVPTGTPVFDWTVPREWNIRDAWIADSSGRAGHRLPRVEPSRRQLQRAGRGAHVARRAPAAPAQLPDQPDLIPYRTSYYARDLGLLSRAPTARVAADGEYEVVHRLDARAGLTHLRRVRAAGSSPTTRSSSPRTAVIPRWPTTTSPGSRSRPALARGLADVRAGTPTASSSSPARSARSPGWRATRRKRGRIRHGLVLACVGDPGPSTYKRSRRGDAEIDRAAAHVLRHGGAIRGRRFLALRLRRAPVLLAGLRPARRLPHAHAARTLPRVPHVGRRPGLRASRRAAGLARRSVTRIVEVLEGNEAYVNLNPNGEPQLGRRGLYRADGGAASCPDSRWRCSWVLNLSDGEHTLLDIAERADLPFSVIRAAASALESAALLRAV